MSKTALIGLIVLSYAFRRTLSRLLTGKLRSDWPPSHISTSVEMYQYTSSLAIVLLSGCMFYTGWHILEDTASQMRLGYIAQQITNDEVSW